MKSNIKILVRSGLFLAIAIVFQFIGKVYPIPQVSQYIVGPAVNAVLLVSTYVCGIWWGIAVGVLTPLTAWLIGQLPQPMAPFIPFIIAGNILFIGIFGICRKFKGWGIWTGYAGGAVIKFIFLYIAASKLVKLFNIKVPKPIVAMMGIPQLITALIGGAAAILIIFALRKRLKSEELYGQY